MHNAQEQVYRMCIVHVIAPRRRPRQDGRPRSRRLRLPPTTLGLRGRLRVATFTLPLYCGGLTLSTTFFNFLSILGIGGKP